MGNLDYTQHELLGCKLKILCNKQESIYNNFSQTTQPSTIHTRPHPIRSTFTKNLVLFPLNLTTQQFGELRVEVNFKDKGNSAQTTQLVHILLVLHFSVSVLHRMF